MKINLKLLASFLSITVLVSIIAITIYIDFIKMEQLIDEISEINTQSLILLSSTVGATSLSLSMLLSYLVVGGVIRDYTNSVW